MSGPVYYKDVKYSVCWYDGKNTLLRMDNLHNKGDVLIPKKLPDGREIDAIARNFCPGGLCGHFSKIIIDNDISNIENSAFSSADVDEVIWPSKCSIIPCSCFEESRSDILPRL